MKLATIALLILSLTHAAHADVTAPAAAPPTTLQLLIWSGADDRPHAEALLDEYRQRFGGDRSSDPTAFELHKPYPQVLESAKVQGLKPGFFIVALGVCAAPDPRLVKTLSLLQRGVYTRAVTGLPETCPTLADNWDDGGHARFRTLDGFELSAVVLTAAQDDELSGRCPIFVSLRDSSGKLVGSSSEGPRRCIFTSVRANKQGIVIEYEYTSRGCTQDERSTTRELFTVADGKLVGKTLSDKVTRKMSCDD
jgi:hypothetical protein